MLSAKIVGLDDKFQEIWSWIMEEKMKIIAVTGEGGVGKTTLLRLINEKLSSTGSYSTMIWVSVSRDFRIGKVQDEIWRKMGSLDQKWVEKSIQEKAKCIHNVLCQNKFVLILDDVWDPIDLTSLGVPDLETEKNASIVLFSSRNYIAFHEMGIQRIFQLHVLTEESAWDLFRMKVGEDILTGNPKIAKFAKQISSLCYGYPIFIRTVAGTMACKKTYKEWKLALEVLQQNMEQQVLQPRLLLRFCYDSLPNDMVKVCFLYFSLFPEDFIISKNDLIDFWICEEFFGYYDSKYSALNLGCSIIDVLIRVSLFEEEENDSVKMLDTIRDFALDLAIESSMFKKAQLVDIIYALWYGKSDAEGTFKFDAITSNTELGVGRILSMKNIFKNFPNISYNLLTFFVQRNPFIMFKNHYIPELTALDLSKSFIEEVPRGISQLVSLKHLNMSHTYIVRLPVELKKLKKLKCLNLENDDQLRIIPRQVISSLTSLQVLRMFHCGFSVQEEDDNILSATYMDLSEFHCLKSLKLFTITITCASALENFFSTHILSSCTHALSLEVFWGSKSLDISSVAAMEHLLTLEIRHAELLRNIKVNFVMEKNFISLQEVNVEKCSNLQDLSWLILAPNLVILRVSYCPEMEEIISIEKLGKILNPNKNPFAKLEVLELESLSKLKSIYGKALPFELLKKIQVIDCPLLKKLPLNANSAKRFASNIEDVEIIAEEDWLKQVEWEDVATEERFHSCFKTPLVERNWPPLRLSPLPQRSYVVRWESDGPRDCQQRFKQYFCGCLSGKSEA